MPRRLETRQRRQTHARRATAAASHRPATRRPPRDQGGTSFRGWVRRWAGPVAAAPRLGGRGRAAGGWRPGEGWRSAPGRPSGEFASVLLPLLRWAAAALRRCGGLRRRCGAAALRRCGRGWRLGSAAARGRRAAAASAALWRRRRPGCVVRAAASAVDLERLRLLPWAACGGLAASARGRGLGGSRGPGGVGGASSARGSAAHRWVGRGTAGND